MIGFDDIIHYFLTQIGINVASDSLYAETRTKFLEGEFFYFTDPASAAGFHFTIRCRQALHGALIFPPEKRLFDAMIDEIPGKALIRATLPVDIKIRVCEHSFKGLGPVTAVGMGHQQDIGNLSISP
jgi:hypothetical protein